MTSFSVTVANPKLIKLLSNILMTGFKSYRMDVYNKLFSLKTINGYFVTCELYLDCFIRSCYFFPNKYIYSINPGYVLPVWFIFVKNYSLINRIIKQRTCQLRNLPRCKKFQNCCTIIKMVKRFLPLIYAICGFIHTVYHENYKLDFVSNINYLWAYNDKSSKKYQFDREIVK